MKVVIEGIDPNPPPNAASPDITTTQLFPPYETTADITDGELTKDFDVPADAAKAKPAQETMHINP